MNIFKKKSKTNFILNRELRIKHVEAKTSFNKKPTLKMLRKLVMRQLNAGCH